MSELMKLVVYIWLRYLDDIFCATNKKKDADLILEYFNNQQSNPRFTIEYGYVWLLDDTRLALYGVKQLRICSEDNEGMVEINKLKLILEKNDFPREIIEKYITKFLTSKKN